MPVVLSAEIKQKNNAVVLITVFILKMKNYEKDF